MIRAGRIPRSRTNALVFLADQFLAIQALRSPKTPRDARLLMQVLRKRLRQPIRQRFGHDGIVIIVLSLKLLGEFIAAMNRDSKTTKIILTRLWPDVIRQRVVLLTCRLFHL